MTIIRQCWIGLLIIPLSIAVAIALTAAFGPLLGAWNWQATSFILLSAATLVLLMLDGSTHNTDSPASRIAPGMAHQASPGSLDNLTSAHVTTVQMYRGTAEPPSHQSRTPIATTGWILQALVTSVAALVFLVILLV